VSHRTGSLSTTDLLLLLRFAVNTSQAKFSQMSHQTNRTSQNSIHYGYVIHMMQ